MSNIITKLSPANLRPFLQHLVKLNGSCAVLTGAGVSTDSGIPDYRGPKGVYVTNPNHKPITYQQFTSSLYNRKRYWLRSFFGYERVAKSKPNSIHFDLTKLQKEGLISSIITQNVDGLHQKSGSKNVVEMHGSLDNVSCTTCGYQISRDDFQFQLKHLNPDWERFFKPEDPSNIKTTPDGDVQLSDSTNYEQFNLPDCPKCDTPTFKPKVVFFGENMSPNTRDQIYDIIKENQMLFVLGSSLTVPSAYRLVLASREFSIVNLSPTKYDDQAKLAYHTKIDEFLDQLIKLKS